MPQPPYRSRHFGSSGPRGPRRSPGGRPDRGEAAPRTGGVRDGLEHTLRQMDGSSYGRYKSLMGRWRLGHAELEIVRAQADPYAPPARVALHVPSSVAQLPPELWDHPVRRRALASYLTRQAVRAAGGEGLVIDAGGQEVLDRSACQIADETAADPGAVTLRLNASLPGQGRRIDGTAAHQLLCVRLPRLVERALRYAALDDAAARRFVHTVEDSDALRRQLADRGLVAFVANGAMLPRRSGVDDRPLRAEGAVPFRTPEELSVTVELPHAGRVTGMGVPEGVTLIVGGGFHGKSTLLRALEAGVWDHLPDDGRELVVSRADTVKIRAEDGRRIEGVDLHAFVNHLPTGQPTDDFRTENASGSTSQAASLVEAVEAGASTLLIDEDTAATNLMIRDARMQALVAKEQEPLTPFIDLVRSLHRDRGVSTVLVMGGCGDYLEVADRVIMMDAYTPSDVTDRARELARVPTGRTVEGDRFPETTGRRPVARSVDAEARGRTRLQARGTDALVFGESTVDLRSVEQITDASYVLGVGHALELLVRGGHLEGNTVAEALDALERELADGVGPLLAIRDEAFAVPRRFEVAAALNRLRTLRVRH
ncbi:ABC-ATPase domain-containing protein [Streptomyces sp. NPDC005438]|uniref:ABC-ATPase domain-containing protein n=1 Tax=Streptomyces sp. NPDC005438 TaxID=3156880 RepID=UPI0033B4DE51